MNNLKLTIFSIILGFSFSNAQEISLKDDNVLLDGKTILKYEKINLTQYSFYDLNDDEILMFKSFDNETPKYIDDDFYVLNFLVAKKKIESTDFSLIVSGLGINSRKNMEKMIKRLIKEKVLTVDGKINNDKLDIFYEKYNENVMERTTR
jgi:hypothetical protein